MKTDSIFALLVTACIITAGYFYHPPTTAITVLYDVTAEKTILDDPEDIINLFGLDRSKYRGAYFRLHYITDKRFSKAYSAYIPSVVPFHWNTYKRSDDIAAFVAQVDSIYTLASSYPSGFDRSVIWEPIIDELVKIQEVQSKRKICILHSDLVENGALDLYKDGEQFKDKSVLKTALLGIAEPGVHEGVEVAFMYRPIDYDDQERYSLISDVMREILEDDAGCTVTIGSSYEFLQHARVAKRQGYVY